MSAERLEVWLEGRQAGVLEPAGGTLAFRYAQAYREDPAATPLSLSMPLAGPERHEGGPAHLFFAGLLPEGRVLEYVASQHRVSDSNVFGLLEAIGGDCAGAVSIVPPGAEATTTGASYEPIAREGLARMLRDLPRMPLATGAGGIRLSLAGAQNKLPIAFDGTRFALPCGAAPSTHILKPPMAVDGGFAWATVENEAFCLALARRVGLAVPRSWIIDVGGPVLLIERYDREIFGGGDSAGNADADRDFSMDVRRIHQEDFCQALAIAPGAKYENEGGPSFARCMHFTRGHADVPVRDGIALIRWLIFNYLIGNADAHAKNLSILLRGPHVQLAPFYDLVSTAVYPAHTTKMAMKIGGHYDPAFLGRTERWQRAAADAGMNWPSFRRTLRDVVDRVAAEAGPAREEVEAQAGGRVALIGTIIEEVIGRNRARLDGVLGRK